MVNTRRGVVAALALVGVLAFLSLLGLVVDGGLLYMAHAELRCLADVAAVATLRWGGPASDCPDYVRELLRRNGKADCRATVLLEESPSGRRVRVELEAEPALLLSSFRAGPVRFRAISWARSEGGGVTLRP